MVQIPRFVTSTTLWLGYANSVSSSLHLFSTDQLTRDHANHSIISILDTIHILLLTNVFLSEQMLNPIIYVTFHQDFRRAFKYLLCFQCATMGSKLRAEAYQSQYGTERAQYIPNEFAANTDSIDNKLIHYRADGRSTGRCSSVEITGKDRNENEATL